MAAALPAGPGPVAREVAPIEVAVGAPCRAGVPGFVNATSGAVNPLVGGGMSEQVQMTLQVEHVSTSAWPGLRLCPGERAAAEAAGGVVGLCCLVGG